MLLKFLPQGEPENKTIWQLLQEHPNQFSSSDVQVRRYYVVMLLNMLFLLFKLCIALPGLLFVGALMGEYNGSKLPLTKAYVVILLTVLLFIQARLWILPLAAAVQWCMIILMCKTFKVEHSPRSFPTQWNNGEGKIALITGVNFNGIGYEMCKSLVILGYSVIVVDMYAENRFNEVKTQLIKDIQENNDNSNVSAAEKFQLEEDCDTKITFIQADLTKFEDLRRIVSDVKRKHSILDVLINNAGAGVDGVTDDGFAITFMLCYIAPYCLTTGLLPLLQNSKDARVVNTSSAAANMVELVTQKNFNIEHVKPHAPEVMDFGFAQYCRAKYCIALFTSSLQKQLLEDGVDNVLVNCFHPGAVASNVWLALQPVMGPVFPLFLMLMQECLRTPEEGSRTGVWLAASTNVRREHPVCGKWFYDYEAFKVGLEVENEVNEVLLAEFSSGIYEQTMC